MEQVDVAPPFRVWSGGTVHYLGPEERSQVQGKPLLTRQNLFVQENRAREKPLSAVQSPVEVVWSSLCIWSSVRCSYSSNRPILIGEMV